MVVDGTDSGHPAASTALRPTLKACSPTWETQPMITSSTSAGSNWLRLATALRASDARSAGCQFLNFPLRLPPGVRTASTMTATGMIALSLRGLAHRTEPRRRRKVRVLGYRREDDRCAKEHGSLAGRRRDGHRRRARRHVRGLRRGRRRPRLGERLLRAE